MNRAQRLVKRYLRRGADRGGWQYKDIIKDLKGLRGVGAAQKRAFQDIGSAVEKAWRLIHEPDAEMYASEIEEDLYDLLDDLHSIEMQMRQLYMQRRSPSAQALIFAIEALDRAYRAFPHGNAEGELAAARNVLSALGTVV